MSKEERGERKEERDASYKLEHPGYPLNSQGDDFGMTFEGLHNRGYVSSNRGDARGWDHIYSFEKSEVLVTVKGWVYEQDGYECQTQHDVGPVQERVDRAVVVSDLCREALDEAPDEDGDTDDDQHQLDYFDN